MFNWHEFDCSMTFCHPFAVSSIKRMICSPMHFLLNVILLISCLSPFDWASLIVLLRQILDLGSGAMICGVLFSISTVTDHLMTPNFFHVAFFYSGLIIQLYTNCFYGSQVFVTVTMKCFAFKIFFLWIWTSINLTEIRLVWIKSNDTNLFCICFSLKSISEWEYSWACLLLWLGGLRQIHDSHSNRIEYGYDAIEKSLSINGREIRCRGFANIFVSFQSQLHILYRFGGWWTKVDICEEKQFLKIEKKNRKNLKQRRVM